MSDYKWETQLDGRRSEVCKALDRREREQTQFRDRAEYEAAMFQAIRPRRPQYRVAVLDDGTEVLQDITCIVTVTVSIPLTVYNEATAIDAEVVAIEGEVEQ